MENSKILILSGILIAVVLISGCVQAPAHPANLTSQTEKEIPFETIEKGEYSGYTEKANLVINDEETFFKLWRNYTSIFGCPTCGALVTPKISFSNETIIAVFMGEKNTGGYSISIERISNEGDMVFVFVKETSPQPGDLVTQALTQPYHIVKTEKVTKQVKFQISKNDNDFEILNARTVIREANESAVELDPYACTVDIDCKLSGVDFYSNPEKTQIVKACSCYNLKNTESYGVAGPAAFCAPTKCKCVESKCENVRR